MINNLKIFITDNKKDLKYLIILILFLLAISIPKLLIQYKVGIGNWDTFLYLENGRNFAKMGWGDVPSIAPVLPVLLSKLFLLAGHPYQRAIFNVDVIFYILGAISFYLILRLKFKHNVSLVGSIIYSTFTLLYSWVAIGGNDILGTTGTLLSMYFIFISHKYNNKLYILALPIAAYSFLSRYTAGVMLFAILLYWIINRVNLKEIKYIITGSIIGIISISWFLYEFNKHLDTPFPFLGQFSGTVSNTVVLDAGFLPDSWYYIKHIPNYLLSTVPKNVNNINVIVNPMGNTPSIVSYIYIALFIFGIILLIYNIYSKVKESKIQFNKNKKLLLTAGLILALIGLITIGNISYIFSSLISLICLCIFYHLLNDYNIENIDIDFTMLELFIIYLVFQSILFTKNDRYFITVLPFIAYFITYSLNEIFIKLDERFKWNKTKVSKIITALIILFLLSNTLVFANNVPEENDYADIKDACEWLKNYDNITNNTLIHSDDWPGVSWYMNIFCQRGVPDTSNASSIAEFSREILSRNNSHYASSYYIDCTHSTKFDYPGLVKIKKIGSVEIYENKYLKKNGPTYIYTKEYNNRLQREIEEFNKTNGGKL